MSAGEAAKEAHRKADEASTVIVLNLASTGKGRTMEAGAEQHATDQLDDSVVSNTTDGGERMVRIV